MNIQSQFNNDALKQLPKIVELIKSAQGQDRDNIIDRALREICNSRVALDDMTASQKDAFQEELLRIFLYWKQEDGQK